MNGTVRSVLTEKNILLTICFSNSKNLDVNLAVNNLFQRDDEGDDPTDDEDPYMHGGNNIQAKN